MAKKARTPKWDELNRIRRRDNKSGRLEGAAAQLGSIDYPEQAYRSSPGD